MSKLFLSRRGIVPILAAAWFCFLAASSLRLAWAGLRATANDQRPAQLEVEVDPRASSAWIALGLDAELCGNYQEAERDLLEAAHVDHQYVPAWTLANFYFRRLNRRAFWLWAQRAAALSYTDLEPLLQLCDRIEPVSVLALLGDSEKIERAYLNLLIRENRMDDAQGVARKLLTRRSTGNRPLLAAFTSRQIEAGNLDHALEIWKGLFPSDAILSNGGPSTAPSGEGFDWRLHPSEGVTAQWHDSRMTFSFSGKQPEACVLFEQVVALDTGRYRLRFGYSMPARSSAIGIHWALAGNESSVLAPMVPGEAWREGEWIFRIRRKVLARLDLVYRREPGTTRSPGNLEIRNLILERP